VLAPALALAAHPQFQLESPGAAYPTVILARAFPNQPHVPSVGHDNLVPQPAQVPADLRRMLPGFDRYTAGGQSTPANGCAVREFKGTVNRPRSALRMREKSAAAMPVRLCAARTVRRSRSTALMISAARMALNCSASALGPYEVEPEEMAGCRPQKFDPDDTSNIQRGTRSAPLNNGIAAWSRRSSARITIEPGTEMGRQVAIVLYVVAMAAVIVGVDFVFFRNRFWERLTVNIGIVLVFAAFYLRFLRRP
jgi:hypothetical protein